MCGILLAPEGTDTVLPTWRGPEETKEERIKIHNSPYRLTFCRLMVRELMILETSPCAQKVRDLGLSWQTALYSALFCINCF